MKFFLEDKQIVLDNLGVDIRKGLNHRAASRRLAKYGANEITIQKKPSIWQDIRSAVTEQMIVILLIASGISILVGEYEDGLGILFAITLGITIGVITEGKSKKAAESLAEITQNIKTKTLRKGEVVSVNKDKLVPGDIVMLEMGDMVPADGRIIENHNLKIREDMLTGEAEEVDKKDTIVQMEISGQDPIPANQINMLFAGTFVSYGKGQMVVTGTGDNTKMGEIAKNLNQKEIDTPLQIKLGNLGSKIAKISTSVAIMLFVYMTFNMVVDNELIIDTGSVRSLLVSLQPLNNILVVCIALIVAAVPEGLPTMVNMTLAITMQKMAKINALVTKKEACETIGAVSVICSDKTGTLTQNKMTVEKVSINNEKYFLENCILNSTGDIKKTKTGYTCFGSSTECALLLLHKNINYKKIREDTPIIAQELFTSERKRMTTIIEKNNKYILLCKGAPEVIMNLCDFKEKKEKDKVLDNIKRLQDKSMRTLAFSYKVIPKNSNFRNIDRLENNMIFMGFVGIKDPLREGVKESILHAKAAGVETKMLTGDNIHTARAIGNELGIIGKESKVVEASYIDMLSDSELEKEIGNISIVARSKPETKMRIVESLQNLNEVVAVTGDGINDAPALVKSDVGIAMGISGTEVTKNSSDIILVDDSFSTIIQAIKWGRGIYENFQRFIQFQITVNIVAFLIAIISQIGGYSMPFTTVQLLWVNIIMDGPPALALGLEPVRKSLLYRRPIKRNASIITKPMLFSMLFNSGYITGLLYLQMKFNILGAHMFESQTVIFSLFAMCSLMNAFNCREFRSDSVFKYFFNNKAALRVIIGTIIVQIFLTEVCQGFFSSVSLSFVMWTKILTLSLTVIVACEFIKYLIRTFKTKKK